MNEFKPSLRSHPLMEWETTSIGGMAGQVVKAGAEKGIYDKTESDRLNRLQTQRFGQIGRYGLISVVNK